MEYVWVIHIWNEEVSTCMFSHSWESCGENASKPVLAGYNGVSSQQQPTPRNAATAMTSRRQWRTRLMPMAIISQQQSSSCPQYASTWMNLLPTSVALWHPTSTKPDSTTTRRQQHHWRNSPLPTSTPLLPRLPPYILQWCDLFLKQFQMSASRLVARFPPGQKRLKLVLVDRSMAGHGVAKAVIWAKAVLPGAVSVFKNITCILVLNRLDCSYLDSRRSRGWHFWPLRGLYSEFAVGDELVLEVFLYHIGHNVFC